MRFPEAWELGAPRRRPGALPAAAALVLALAACEDPQEPPPIFTIDAPTGVAFSCYGRMRMTGGQPPTDAQPIVTTLLPMDLCRGWDLVTITVDDNDTSDRDDDTYTLDEIPPAGQGPIGLTRGQQLDKAQRDALGEWLRSIHLYGFVVQRNPGTVAVTRGWLGNAQLIDSWDGDPFAPGVNVIPVGSQPVGIVSDPAGCHLLTANAGSCDLSVLDVPQVLSGEEVPAVRSVSVRNAAGELLAIKPRAVVSQPGSPPADFECPDSFDSLVYVAYPDCNAVAAVDAATGEIRGSVVFNEDGSVIVGGGELSCGAATCGAPGEPSVDERPDGSPADTDASLPDAGAPDAAPADAGPSIAAVGTRPRPVALHVADDGKRLYIGAENSPQVTVVELDENALPATAWSVPLEGDVGVTALAATEVIAMGGASGYSDEGPFGDFRFVYAVATDNTVRVAEVHERRRECDTQIDPRFLRDVRDGQVLACLPIGDPALPRRVGARAPGIQMPGGARPLDVAFVSAPRVRATPEYRPPVLPGTLIGHFAFVSLSTGEVVVVNVDDDNYGDLEDTAVPVEVDLSLALPHQIRDSGLNRRNSRYCKPIKAEDMADAGVSTPAEHLPLTCTTLANPDCSYTGLGTTGLPTVTTDPEPTPAADTVQYLSQDYLDLGALPALRGVECMYPPPEEGAPDPGADEPDPIVTAVSELSLMAQDSLRETVFPDLRSVNPVESWNIAWEGALTLQGPAESIRLGVLDADVGLVLQDSGRPFCAMGAEPGDVVALLGCDPALGAAQCQEGEVCTTFDEAAGAGRSGICVLAHREDTLAQICESFLASQRRFLVQETYAGRLVLAERKHVLRTTPIEGCSSAEQCTLLGELARDMAAGRDLKAPTPPDTCGEDDPCDAGWQCSDDGFCIEPTPSWACEPDPLRDPGRNVCLMTCGQDSDCDAGLQCADDGYCVEAVLPPAECVEALQQYQVRAGEVFTVTGAFTGFLHDRIADPVTDQCIADPLASPLATGRIPLDVPPCVSGDGFTDVTPNPCATTLLHSHYVLQPKLDEDGKPELDEDGNPIKEEQLMTRQTSAIRFRNPAFVTNLVDPLLDPAAQGIPCTLDGAPCPRFPIVFPGYSLVFTISGGFVPLQALGGLKYPVELVPDPLGDIWVMDQSGGQVVKMGPIALQLRGDLQ